jgi:AsmA protein
MGWLKRSFLYLLIIALLLVSSSYLFILTYEDEIKASLIQQVNQHLLGNVQVNDMSIAPFQNFPSVAVSLDEAVLKKENFGDQEKVAAFKHVYVSMDFYEFLQGRYVVEKVLLDNGALNLRVDENGNKNYQIFSMDKREDPEGESNFYFDVQQIRITQTSFLYKNQIKEIAFQGFFDAVNLQGQFKDQDFKLKADLKSLVEQFKIKNVNYIEQKKVNLQTTLQVDGKNELYEVKQGNLRIAGADFNLKGEITNKAKAYELNVHVNGKKNRLSTLLALLPGEARNKFDQYQGEGQIQFEAAITGNMSPIQKL